METVKTMAADDLAMHEARASASEVLTKFSNFQGNSNTSTRRINILIKQKTTYGISMA